MLIITCPCALGLAVPMVHVVAARRLFANGIMMRDGAALERLGEIDSVVFDKTGTLTLGTSCLVDNPAVDSAHLRLAATIAAHSQHPYARALVAADASGGPSVTLDRVCEHPGAGLEARSGATVYRLGRAEWALDPISGREVAIDDLGTVLSRNGRRVAEFRFDDRIRPGAREAIATLARSRLDVAILSGDRPSPVRRLAAALAVERFDAGVRPDEKVARLAALAAADRHVLMVGDGLNDAPALAAAHVSMAPATAADVGRNAADFVFLREGLQAVPFAIGIARDARRLVRENLIFAVFYNVFAVPIAVLGHVTPLVAALTMSFSSIIVVGNALRLKGDNQDEHALYARKVTTSKTRTSLIRAAIK